jgi:cysteine synthase
MGHPAARFGLETSIVDSKVRDIAARHFRERGILLPTFAELEAPEKIDEQIAARVAATDPDAPDPLNLFRIHWFNARDRHERAGVPEHVVLPTALTGVHAPIVVVFGDCFPLICAHKVLAAYGCLAPRLVTGQFDPTRHRAVWPSTGNYCRGGVAVSRIMGCRGVAVLPENMSQERFAWLERWVEDPADIVRTRGSESNVKEIYDTCAELERDSRNVILNQFCEFGNALAHYYVTGSAFQRVFEHLRRENGALSAHSFVSATGSAGTLAAGDRLKSTLGTRIVAVEPLECPTLLQSGFGEHNIQGAGDRHIPYIHNVHNTDDLVGISDQASDALYYLAGESEGRRYLADRRNVSSALITQLARLGLSGWANVLASISIARAHDLGPDDAVLTVATDSGRLYVSERPKIRARCFEEPFDLITAAEVFSRYVLGAGSAHHLELSRLDRERIFNLGYFTWVEQRGVSVEDFIARRKQQYWRDLQPIVESWDERIQEFNRYARHRHRRTRG